MNRDENPAEYGCAITHFKPKGLCDRALFKMADIALAVAIGVFLGVLLAWRG